MAIDREDIKKYCSYFLIFVCYFSLFIHMNPVINYVIHKGHYKNDLCIEREIPQSCCEGKCQLKNEIERNERPVNNNSAIPIPNIKIDILINWYLQQFNSGSVIPSLFKSQLFHLNSAFQSIFIDLITPPPKI